MQNWRPISLLNTDYKILSKALSNRLIKVLPSIIGKQQYGFMKNRFIGNYCGIVTDVMGLAKQKKLCGFLLALDMEKAFNSVSWVYLFKTLEWFNFGNSFIHWMQVLYRDAKACVINNGFTNNYFKLCKGVRQGDPISPYLFNIAIKVLALHIINNNQIKGININNDLIIKICQYADDITVFLSDINFVRLILQVIQDFSFIIRLETQLE